MIRILKSALGGLALLAAMLPALAAAPAARPLLPEAFAGWELAGPLRPAPPLEAAQAAALAEYGQSEAIEARYRRSGDSLTLRALRFRDASGAFGAYSFYRQDNWPREKIGSGAASFHNRILFWQAAVLIEATVPRVGPMTAADLRELAAALPRLEGSRAAAPPVLTELPQRDLDAQTTHYALGPAGYAGAGGVLPPSLAAFDQGAEAVTALYRLRSGPATLTLIDCPTPQMAAALEQRIHAYLQAGAQAQPAWPRPLADSNRAALGLKRSGPIVALVSGDATPDDSRRLLASVHYAADLTSMPVGGESEISKTSRLLMGIAGVVLVGALAALVLGFGLGGGRILYRIWRGKPASSVSETEFIRLNLQDDDRKP